MFYLFKGKEDFSKIGSIGSNEFPKDFKESLSLSITEWKDIKRAILSS